MVDPIFNEQAMAAEFAQNLWNNYIKFKMDEVNMSNVSFYRAAVTSNPGDGTLVVQQPYDNEIKINSTSALSGVAVGTEIVVARLGNSNAAMNHLAFATAEGNTYAWAQLASKTYKHVTANTWEYIGQSIILSTEAFVFLTSTYSSGRPTGLGLHTDTTGSYPRTICYEAYDAQRTPIYFVGAGTYYVYEKRDSAASSNNTISVYRVYV